jgi:hypothetical protein
MTSPMFRMHRELRRTQRAERPGFGGVFTACKGGSSDSGKTIAFISENGTFIRVPDQVQVAPTGSRSRKFQTPFSTTVPNQFS